MRHAYPGLDRAAGRAWADADGFAMPPSLLLLLAELAPRAGSETILELGSGASTGVLARSARPGARLVTVDDDPARLAAAIRHVCGVGLVAIAPDDIDHVRESCAGRRVALVVVDGPAGRDRFAGGRLEALLELAEPGATWVVDDTDRLDIDGAAAAIAAARGLERRDYEEPLSPGHRYAVLSPPVTPAPDRA